MGRLARDRRFLSLIFLLFAVTGVATSPSTTCIPQRIAYPLDSSPPHGESDAVAPDG